MMKIVLLVFTPIGARIVWAKEERDALKAAQAVQAQMLSPKAFERMDAQGYLVPEEKG